MMSKRVLPVLSLCFLSLPAWPESAPAVEPEPVPQVVLVTGSRPGPGLWKVSKGEHVMWVFGTYSPLPTKMEWRSRDIEKIIATSQEYLKPPTAHVGVGWMGGIGALPFLIGVRKNPDGAALKDLLPPDVSARWQPLKQTYFGGDDDIERERPAFVAAQLYGRAMKQAGLSGSSDVRKTIEKLVDKHKIKVTDARHSIQIKEPGKALREFKKSPMADAACLTKTIARLDTDVNIMRARANAWAVGELDEIRKIQFDDRNDNCFDAEKALANNASTFAVVEIKDILDPKGVIATLQGKGYTIEAPK